MRGLKSLTDPSLTMIIITCPLCRGKSSISEYSFTNIMFKARRSGVLLMNFQNINSAFCLAIQPVCDEPTTVGIFTPLLFLVKVEEYLHLLDGAEFDLNALFDEISKKCQTRTAAVKFLQDMIGTIQPVLIKVGAVMDSAGTLDGSSPIVRNTLNLLR